MEKLKVAMYIRVGSREQSKEGSSIETQKERINKYLKERIKGIYSKQYYIDNGFSGTTYNRPEFRRMIEDIENKKINMIIVNDLVRFGRTNNTFDRIEALKRKYKVDFVSVTDDIDSINNKIEFEQMVLIQKYFKDELRKSIRASRRLAKERLNKC